MKHLYFVRHGLSVMNKSSVFSGRSNTPLSEEGRAQATEAGRELKGVKIDCIVASPMERALETAQIIADEIGYPRDKIVTHELFIERDFGPLEGTPYRPNLGDEEGVETLDSVLSRAGDGLAFLNSLPHDNILVVSHSGVGRALRHHVDPSIPFKQSPSFANGEVVKLR